jgi:hypothetical protein
MIARAFPSGIGLIGSSRLSERVVRGIFFTAHARLPGAAAGSGTGTGMGAGAGADPEADGQR